MIRYSDICEGCSKVDPDLLDAKFCRKCSQYCYQILSEYNYSNVPCTGGILVRTDKPLNDDDLVQIQRLGWNLCEWSGENNLYWKAYF